MALIEKKWKMKKDYEQGDRVTIKNHSCYFNLKTATVLHNRTQDRKQNLVLIVDNIQRSRIYVSYSNVKTLNNWFAELI
jgi:nanoRNase/pAp phosphatase (c-di-AMP/oligoRNAs hydrolase)